MAEKFKKIDREFLLSDSSLNCYKYRLLTSGYLFDEFKKNPIGYYLHGTEEFPREAGVLVKWEDLRMDGDKVFGKPSINLNHPRGQRTADEIEAGFLNAASFGHFVVLEVSNDPKDYVDGQEGPTVSKWFNRECSLVDIPGNYNAVAEELYDVNDTPYNLADFTKPQIQKMKQVFLTPEQITKLNLKAEPTQQDVESAIVNLVAEAAKVPDLTSRLQNAESAKKKAEDDLAALKASTMEKEVKDLVAGAITGKKITKEVGDKLEKQFAGKPADLKDLIDTMPVYSSITEAINSKNNTNELQALVAKDYDALDKEGKLERLKELSGTEFQNKYKERFGKEYGK